MTATAGLKMSAGSESRPSTAVPASAEQPYHPPGANLVLGDVTPYRLFDDPAEAEAFTEALVAFVESGGGLLFHTLLLDPGAGPFSTSMSNAVELWIG